MDNILRKIEQYLIGTLLLAITFILFINVVLRILDFPLSGQKRLQDMG